MTKDDACSDLQRTWKDYGSSFQELIKELSGLYPMDYDHFYVAYNGVLEKFVRDNDLRNVSLSTFAM